jgi:TetR/AcrR family transcriptional regulator, ethionamide resistance regulator
MALVNAESEVPGRRRSRLEVEADVRAALLRLLDEGKPFKDLTVDELARAAGLSRTAFYFYFPGKNQVLMAVLGDVAEEMYAEADRWWHGEGPPEQLVRVAMEGIVGVFQRHTAPMRSAFEVTTYDPEMAAFWNRVMARFVSATAEHLRREQQAGRLRSLDSNAVAEVLVWMVERCNHELIGTQGRPTEHVVDAFTTVWVHTLYPDAVAGADS